MEGAAHASAVQAMATPGHEQMRCGPSGEEAAALSQITGQNLLGGRMQRDQARLAELGLLNGQDVLTQVNIVQLQVQRLTDAQT
jgi:hypothetical protein